MAYDIPDKIQYKEKIVFGLTLRELLHAVAFALVAFFAYQLPLPGYYKFVLPALAILAGIGFIKLGWGKTAIDRWNYHWGVREGGSLDKRVQEFVGIRKIENDTMYLASGQMRSILSVTPINYQNMDEDRQKSVTENYRSFLNQLSHPIQINVRTVNVTMAEYFAHNDNRVDKSDNQKLVSLYSEMKTYEQGYLAQNVVKERLYYLIVPYNPFDSLARRYKDRLQIFWEQLEALIHGKLDLFAAVEDETHRKELADRTAILQQKLRECSIVSRRMGTNEMISFLMSYFDGYAEVNEDYMSRLVVGEKFAEHKRGESDGKTEAAIEAAPIANAHYAKTGRLRHKRRGGASGRKFWAKA